MIPPSIGRKVWYWPVGEPEMVQFDDEVPLDATIIFPENVECVNLRITDHAGGTHIRTNALLHQGQVDTRPPSSCATWMPYQLGQAAKTFQDRTI